MNYRPLLAIVVLIVFFAAIISAIGLFLFQMGWFN
jgi:hypothetical protein